jgi:hypothetical protein
MKRMNFLYASNPGCNINPYFCAVYIGPRLKEEYSRNFYLMPSDENDWTKIICPWLMTQFQNPVMKVNVAPLHKIYNSILI